MGRTEDRKQKRKLQKQVGKENFEKLYQVTTNKFVKNMVNEQCRFFEELWMDCTAEALLKHGISVTKAKLIARDIENMVVRRCKANGKVKKDIS